MQLDCPRPRSISLVAGLLVEGIVGLALIAVVASRLDLDDFSVALPCCAVAAAAALLAFAAGSRSMFWCGVLGGVLGTLCTPRMGVIFSPSADPAERALTWSRMKGELNLQYAVIGGIMSVVFGYALFRVSRRYAAQANKAVQPSGDKTAGSG